MLFVGLCLASLSLVLPSWPLVGPCGGLVPGYLMFQIFPIGVLALFWAGVTAWLSIVEAPAAGPMSLAWAAFLTAAVGPAVLRFPLWMLVGPLMLWGSAVLFFLAARRRGPHRRIAECEDEEE
jgi:hypothetical protein